MYASNIVQRKIFVHCAFTVFIIPVNGSILLRLLRDITLTRPHTKGEDIANCILAVVCSFVSALVCAHNSKTLSQIVVTLSQVSVSLSSAKIIWIESAEFFNVFLDYFAVVYS